MGGSPKPPKETDEQRKAQREQLDLQKQQLEAANKPIELPKIEKPKPVLPPPPPPGQSSADVSQAEEDARRKAQRRINTARGTLFAGETGGYSRDALGGQRGTLG